MGCKSITEKPKPKQKHRKGLWSPEEDQRLRDYVLKYGHGCWSSVPINAGLQRNGKSCRLRWINYLRPGLKRGMFTAQEEDTILRLHHVLGNKWSQIAQHLAGRTDNEIKNYWHSYLKKKLAKTELLDHQIKTESNSHSTESPLSQELPTTQNHEFSASQISTQTSFLPKIIFAEWLTPGGDANSCSAGSFSGFEHQPLFDASTISDHSDGLPDSLMQSVLLSGDAGFEGRSGSLEDIISYGSCYSNDEYAKMEDQILESEFLGFVSRNGICSSSEYDMYSGLMYI